MKMIMSKENMDYAKSAVLNCLSYDRQYAIHQRDIKAHTGYDMRTIRFIIQALRDDGEPICSTTYEGYWLACNSLELNHLSIEVPSFSNECTPQCISVSKLFKSKTIS